MNTEKILVDPFDMQLSQTQLSDLLCEHSASGDAVFHMELIEDLQS